jgi:PKD repeat protein
MKRPAGVVAITMILGALLAGCAFLFPPGVDFLISTSEGPEPLVVAFTPVNNESVTSYTWEFGDGETSTAPDPLHVYRAPGTYTVRLTARLVDGTATTVQKTDAVEVTSGPRKATPSYVYWAHYGDQAIWRGPRTGGKPEVVVDGTGYVSALAVTESHIYWANDRGEIRRVRLDGSDRETLFTGQYSVSDLEVDSEFNAILWICEPSGTYSSPPHVGSINLAFLDDLVPLTLLVHKEDAEWYANQLALDFVNDRFYWTVRHMEHLNSYGVQSSWPWCTESIQAATSDFIVTPFQTGLCGTTGLAVDSVPGYGAEHVYWVSREDQQVLRCRVDGTGKEVVMNRAMWFPHRIAVDRLEGKLYLTSVDGIERANLNGTGRQVIYDFISSVGAIALSK